MATANEWHIEDRKRKRTLDRLEFELGLRKTLPRQSEYPLTDKQRWTADERASRIIMTRP